MTSGISNLPYCFDVVKVDAWKIGRRFTLLCPCPLPLSTSIPPIFGRSAIAASGLGQNGRKVRRLVVPARHTRRPHSSGDLLIRLLLLTHSQGYAVTLTTTRSTDASTKPEYKPG